ncbi:Ced12 family of s that are conserved throughout eukaryotes [Cryptosporidium sp. chipmunk genotype I]|uniref:Ced12 family of s that are conserved throughout eukaryotes n=1 Tax=Cryptosporidium sp. chipmunk genotype I TaxID=1280935 RepID=UPI00351A7B8F|nr:Ced12 family of s that are conserved throughout eukaryotes [Cryptosporidium sp. chipmunk genotype I]
MPHPDTVKEKRPNVFQDITSKNSFIPDVTINSYEIHVDGSLQDIIKKKLRREKSRKTIYSKIQVSIINRLWKLSKERKLLYCMRNRCLISLNCTDPNHEQLFQDYWALAYPDHPEINRISSNWKLLGFQNNDPRFDFKCAGLVTLENLVYFAENYRHVFRKILRESQSFSSDEKIKYSQQRTTQSSIINSRNINVIMSPYETPNNFQPSSSNLSVISTPINIKESKKELDSNFEPLLPKITELRSTVSEVSNNSQIDQINVSYPLSAALINVSIMICLYLNLIPSVYKIPGIPNISASRKALRNFIRLTNEFSFNTLPELFSVCAIRFHAEWQDIVKFLGHKVAISEFNKVLKNVQVVMAETIENLPRDIIEFRQICNLEKYY